MCIRDSAEREDTIIATFGDMLKVPGSYSSLSEAQTKGAYIHVIYTPLEVIELSKKHPEKKIVFLAIGFETTIAVICATVKAVHEAGLKNVFFLSLIHILALLHYKLMQFKIFQKVNYSPLYLTVLSPV